MSMLFGTTLGRLSGGYKASLVARVHMRLGNWRKTVMPKEVRSRLKGKKAMISSTGSEAVSCPPIASQFQIWHVYLTVKAAEC